LLAAAGGFLLGGLWFGLTRPAETGANAHGATTAPVGTVWTCSMHPQIRQPEPGKCPICGMDLIPVNGSENEADVTGRVELSARAQALARLQTTPVRRIATGGAGLRLLGRIEPNETTLRTVTAWTGGRIDRLHVKTTGERVRSGQVIATLYSPEVFAAHQDLIVAKRQVERMQSAVPSALQAAQQALEASRERLRLLGVPDDEVTRMEGESTPTRAIAIRSPFAGTVMERIATEGAYVATGAPLYKIANLSQLWLQLDAYESDLPRLRVGQTVSIEVAALGPAAFDGKVTFIEPTIDPVKRTARVRVEVQNTDGKLRPGMFAEAVVQSETESDAPAPLVVPASAVLFTGKRSVVYVQVEDGDATSAYEPRTVRLGPRTGASYPVVAGLSEGERVVTRGAFALDADLQIRGGPSMMSSPDDRQSGTWDDAVRLGRADRAKLAPVVEHYLGVQKALAADDLAAARKNARGVVAAARAVEFARTSAAGAVWSDLRTSLLNHAQQLADSDALEHARSEFEGLSMTLVDLVTRLGNPIDEPLALAHCPMAMGSRGASWLQEGKEIHNSYFGASMQSCGEVQNEVEPGAYLPAAKPHDPAAAPSGTP
jgi:Cu(I)/Ag(I) efflux system membrane fusion protein